MGFGWKDIDWSSLIWVFHCPACNHVWSELDRPGCRCTVFHEDMYTSDNWPGWFVGYMKYRDYLLTCVPKWVLLM